MKKLLIIFLIFIPLFSTAQIEEGSVWETNTFSTPSMEDIKIRLLFQRNTFKVVVFFSSFSLGSFEMTVENSFPYMFLEGKGISYGLFDIYSNGILKETSSGRIIYANDMSRTDRYRFLGPIKDKMLINFMGTFKVEDNKLTFPETKDILLSTITPFYRK